MWYTALVMGLAGSLHCLGMCSPLLVASTSGSPQVRSRRLYYNIGRIAVYSVQGALVSSLGFLFDLAGLQKWVSFSLGVVLVIMGIAGVTYVRVPVISKVLGGFTGILKLYFSKLLSRRTLSSTLALGALNGILPCGLTYIALAYCVTLVGPADGFLFMTFFGIGTLPAMLGAAGLIQWIMKRFRLSGTIITTSTIILVGALLVTRGVLDVHRKHQQEITICR